MNLADALPGFLEEADEHLDIAAQHLLEFEQTGDPEILAKMKSPLHTLKGAASMMRLAAFTRVIHLLEDIVECVGGGAIKTGDAAMNLLFEPIDDLKLAVSQMRATGQPVPDEDFEVTLMKLELFALEEHPSAARGVTHAGANRVKAPAVAMEPPEEWDAGSEREMLPLFLTDSRENLEVLSRETLALENEGATSERIDALFRSVHTIKGTSGAMGLQKMQKLAHALEDHLDRVRAGETALSPESVENLLKAHDCFAAILEAIESGSGVIAVPVDPLCKSFRHIAESESPAPSGKSSPPARDDSETTQPAAKKIESSPAATAQTLRVEVAKLDRAMNLVGEIAIKRIRLEQHVRDLNSLSESLQARQRPTQEEQDQTSQLLEELLGELKLDVDHFGFLSGELQEAIMKTRMVPVSQVFRRFPRTVRDIARTLGKQVELVLEGEETEMDKNLVESIADPLMHLLRNALDHGLEDPDERRAAGKTDQGRLRLGARHQAGEILIEIEDNGRGIDIARVKKTAVARGIVTQSEADALTDDAALDLIFQPGFSTAAEVTELSGRGVGMDVVRESISRVKGGISLSTRPREGTLITMRLPLTLAIIHVLVVSAGGETFALPLTSIEEALSVTPEMLKPVGEGLALILRGRSFPIATLSEILGLGEAMSGMGWRPPRNAVIFTTGGRSAALLVDGLVGKQEVVIKSLGRWLERCPFVSGATILGNGRIIAILEPAELLKALHQCRHVATASSTRATTSRPGVSSLPANSPTATRRGRVLLAEDSSTARTFLRQIYESLGMDVEEAGDGLEALERARALNFDLVSTDMMMPNMDGYQLTDALRKIPSYAETPIIMISSRGERIDKTRGFTAGIDDYFTKPLDPGLLVKSLKRLGALTQDHEEAVPA